MRSQYPTPGRFLAAYRLLVVAVTLLSFATPARSEPASGNIAVSGVRTVLITGANRGIGLELARQYAAAGWQVIGTARQPERAEELQRLDVQVVQLDVTEQQSVDRMAAALADQPIDLLINNAGILPMARSIDDIDFDVFNRTLAVNTLGPVRVTRALLPQLRAGTLRTIVNVTSNLGSIEDNSSGGFYGYRESKAALNMFTRSLAAELKAERFTCIVMHPGWVQTDMGGIHAPVTVQDSATGIRSVIAGLTPANNGSFWAYDGRQMPW